MESSSSSSSTPTTPTTPTSPTRLVAHLTVRTTLGQTVALAVAATSSVAALKEAIAAKLGIASAQQRIVHDGREISAVAGTSSASITALGIRSGDTLVLTPAICAGPINYRAVPVAGDSRRAAATDEESDSEAAANHEFLRQVLRTMSVAAREELLHITKPHTVAAIVDNSLIIVTVPPGHVTEADLADLDAVVKEDAATPATAPPPAPTAADSAWKAKVASIIKGLAARRAPAAPTHHATAVLPATPVVKRSRGRALTVVTQPAQPYLRHHLNVNLPCPTSSVTAASSPVAARRPIVRRATFSTGLNRQMVWSAVAIGGNDDGIGSMLTTRWHTMDSLAAVDADTADCASGHYDAVEGIHTLCTPCMPTSPARLPVVVAVPTPSAAPVPIPVPVSAPPVVPVAAPVAKVGRGCAQCNRKLGLLNGIECRCGHRYCTQHRFPEDHACRFDHRAAGRQDLIDANPLVTAAKVPKL